MVAEWDMKPEIVAYKTVIDTMERGIKQGHVPDGWRVYPPQMHVMKAARHALTAALLIDHPAHMVDKETYIEHLEQALCRIAFALTQLTDS